MNEEPQEKQRAQTTNASCSLAASILIRQSATRTTIATSPQKDTYRQLALDCLFVQFELLRLATARRLASKSADCQRRLRLVVLLEGCGVHERGLTFLSHLVDCGRAPNLNRQSERQN